MSLSDRFDGVLLSTQKRYLPQTPGVYSVFSKDDYVFYVGSSVNMRSRWRDHHRARQAMENNAYIGWINCKKEEIGSIEAVLTKELKPAWNRSPMTGYSRSQIFIEREYRDGLDACIRAYGGTLKEHSKNAIVEYLMNRGMARRWDGERWIWYEVEVVDRSASDDTSG